MYRRPTRKKEVLQRISVYTLMSVFVIALVTLTIFIILGYRLDITNGHVERDALVQFDGAPIGAKITIDGQAITKVLPTKQLIVEGEHSFRIEKNGYQTWNKTLLARADTVTWLNYIRLVPLAPQTDIVSSSTPIVAVRVASKAPRVVTQSSMATPNLTLYDLRNSKPEISQITIPEAILTKSSNTSGQHQYELKYIDEQGRYALIVHTASGVADWLAVDMKEPVKSVNITSRLSITIQDAQFAGTNGNLLYALVDGKIRKLDMSNDTISRALVDSVDSFTVKSASLITFSGTIDSGTVRIAGIYRDGDSRATTLGSADAKQVSRLIVDTARYINDDYLFVAQDTKIDIYRGRLPSPDDSFLSTVSLVESIILTQAPQTAGFSPTGQYVYLTTKDTMQTYDTEYDTVAVFANEGSYSWIDAAHVTAVKDGSLHMLDFDGTNIQRIVTAENIPVSVLTSDGKNIYSFAKSADAFVLQRTSLVVN